MQAPEGDFRGDKVHEAFEHLCPAHESEENRPSLPDVVKGDDEGAEAEGDQKGLDPAIVAEAVEKVGYKMPKR